MGPLNELWATLKRWRSKFMREAGRVPVSWLYATEKFLMLNSFVLISGRVPTRELCERSIARMLEELNKETGMVPVSLLRETSKVLK